MRPLRFFALLTALLVIFSCISAWGAQRVVLVESFTNTSCGPCASANPVTHQFIDDYPNQMVLNLQYHMNWPSPTDPFYLVDTADNNGRRTYYGISSVPDMVTDGVNTPEPGSYGGLAAAVGSQFEVVSPFTLDITTSMVGNDMTVDVDVTAVEVVPASGLTLRIALVEPYVLLDPPGSDNGERNFYCTMRDMLPAHTGQDLIITNGQTLSFSETGTVDPSWNDVYAVVFIQNDTTKEILQAGSTLVAPTYEHFYGYPEPTRVGPMMETQSFPTRIMNVGTMGDIYDVTLSYDHPASWGASVCIGANCLPPGTTNVAVPVSAGQEEEISVDITPILEAGQGNLTVTVTSQNVPGNSWSKTFSVISGNTHLLLVDDDASESYDAYYKAAIEANGYTYGTWDRDADGKVDSSLLNSFRCVVWNVGWGFPSLDATDRAAIEAFLTGGGSLFLSGQDIGWDFYDVSGSQYGNQVWFQNHFGAYYMSDDTNDLTLDGVAGDPIGDGLAFSIGGGDGANNQEYPSEINPFNGGVGCLTYSNGREGGVRFDNGTFKTVYFSFGFEGISTAADRSLIMGRVLDWLELDMVPVGDSIPLKPFLASMPAAHPNPFNPKTIIKFDIGGQNPAIVKIDLYNVAGRKIRSLFQGEVQPGPQSFDWNGRNDAGGAAASGLYLARVTVDGQTHSLKMTLAK